MSEQALRQQLYAAYKNRGMMYYHIFQELRQEVGDEKAAEIMKRGIYIRGLEIGKKYAKYGPTDLEGLKDAFLTGSADREKCSSLRFSVVIKMGWISRCVTAL